MNEAELTERIHEAATKYDGRVTNGSMREVMKVVADALAEARKQGIAESASKKLEGDAGNLLTKTVARIQREVKRLSTADVSIEGVTVFGKLRQLLDRSKTEKNDDVWGELIEDNGNKWRIKFRPSDLATAQSLFTKQVVAQGDATYFKTRHPRLDALQIKEDTQRDYLAAFDEFSSDYKDIFKDRDPDEILKDIRG